MVLSFLSFQLSKLVASYRFRLLALVLGVSLRRSESLRIIYISSFFAIMLPGGLGSDGYRGQQLRQYATINLKRLLKGLMLERLSGLFAILLIMTLALLLVLSIYPSIRFGISHVIGIALLAALSVALYRLFLLWAFREFRSIWLVKHGASILLQGAQMLSFLWLASELDPSLHEYVALGALFAASSIISMLPVSLGGIGSREATIYLGAGWLPFAEDRLLAMALMISLFTLITAFMGAAVFVATSQRTRLPAIPGPGNDLFKY